MMEITVIAFLAIALLALVSSRQHDRQPRRQGSRETPTGDNSSVWWTYAGNGDAGCSDASGADGGCGGDGGGGGGD